MAGWNGFCARCGLAVSKYTIDTVNIEGERRTLLLCQRCWIAIRHPEKVLKPKEPTVIAKNDDVKVESHVIQRTTDDPYSKVEGSIKTEGSKHVGEIKE